MICLTAFLRAILWICQITIRLIMEGKGTMENVNLYQEMNDKIADLLLGCEDSAMCLYAGHYIKSLEGQLKGYKDLEEQGKLLKMLCAVGDTVYTNCSMRGWYFRKSDRPYKAKVIFIGVNGGDGFINIALGKGLQLQFNFSDFGKTVFFTYEEAKAALKEQE